jgi:hypothetical protein
MIEGVHGIKGDVNNDGLVLVNDAQEQVGLVLGVSVPLVYQTWAGDTDGDCVLDVGDAIDMVNAWLGI